MRKTVTLTCTLFAAFASLRCVNDAAGPDKLSEPPALPSAASMTIPDFGKGAAAKVSAAQGGNWLAATATVAFWTGVAAVNLAAPAALFAAAHNTTPVPLPDSTGWQWKVGDSAHNAVLTGRRISGQVQWTMVVDGAGKADFTWFSGTSDLSGRDGDWTFNDLLGDGKPQYRFSYALGDSSGKVEADVIKAGDAHQGSYLKWSGDQVIKTFEGYDSQKGDKATITWNAQTGAGRFSTSRDNNQLCWDGKADGYADIFCDQLTLK